jgi:hypothetical protein
MVSIEDLKAQRRWVLWRLELRDGKTTKVPRQITGEKASSTNPATWATHAEVAAHAHKFDGVGVVMGELDGVHLCGVDIDNCCDAATGKFTPESREIVIGLDSYSEFSPSGTGTHVLMVGTLRGRAGMHLPFPGTKAIEIYDSGRYLTFTGRHLGKTPSEILEREDAVNALYDRVLASKAKRAGLTVSVSLSEEERLAQLMAGDTSFLKDPNDPSAADFALCCLLAKKHDCNAFKIDAVFRTSGCYRDKWERDDYRERTITRAVKAVAHETALVFDSDPLTEETKDDSETEFIVEPMPGKIDGWFPKGELSLIGGASGRGKSTWMMPLLEDVRQGNAVYGHPHGKPRDYRILLHDRSRKATKRTIRAAHLGGESVARLVRLTAAQQKHDPAEILASYVEQCPGVEAWFIEGLDFWLGDANSMEDVASILDSLGRVATRRDIAIIATVGSPKMKGKDRYYGRDSLFGSSALGRKAETVVLFNLTDVEDNNSTRRCDVLTRCSGSETFYFGWNERGMVQVEKPDGKTVDNITLLSPSMRKITNLVRAMIKPGDKVTHRVQFGPEREFKKWRDLADESGAVYSDGRGWRLTPWTGATLTETDPVLS